MIVTHLTQSVTTSGGGIAEVVCSLTRAQEDAGDTPRVLSVSDGGEPIGPWPVGSPEFLTGYKFPGMIVLPDLGEKLDNQTPDLTHTHGLWTYLSIGIPRWAHRRERPYVVSPHGMLDSWALANSRTKKRLATALYERRHLRGAACLHALCASEADSIRAFGLENPIAVIPNGVEIPGDCESKLESRDQRKLLLFLGRLHPKKGLGNALRAWSEMKDQHEWKFVIAGWDQGGHEAELKTICDELGLAYGDIPILEFTSEDCNFDKRNLSVIFTGSVFGKKKDSLLRQVSAFILPSFSEGLPVSVLEAWAYSLPVIMTDHCNLPEGFTANAAIRVGTDVASIAQGMRQTLQLSNSDLKSMGVNGSKLVRERFTWSRIAAQTKELYQWVLGNSAKPGFVE